MALLFGKLRTALLFAATGVVLRIINMIIIFTLNTRAISYGESGTNTYIIKEEKYNPKINFTHNMINLTEL